MVNQAAMSLACNKYNEIIKTDDILFVNTTKAKGVVC